MSPCCFFFFFFNAPAPTEIYPLSYTTLFRSYTDSGGAGVASQLAAGGGFLPSPVAGVVEITSGGTTKNYIFVTDNPRSEEHTSELQSRRDLVCRLLLEKKNKKKQKKQQQPQK